MMAKLCKDCEHFKIRYMPIKGFDAGLAECTKHDLVVDFLNMRKFSWLSCVEGEADEQKR